MISEPTRVSAKTTSCIDNIFSNVNNYLVRVDSTFISDHSYQLLSFDSPTVRTVNTHKVILRRQKDGYNRRLINCDNLANESWKVINEHRNTKEVMGIPEIKDATGMRILGAQGVADSFANFFSNLPPCNAQLENIHLNVREDTFFRNPCSEEVFRVIQRTSKKSSPGIDEIDGRAVRAVAAEVSGPLAYLING
ncbi:hypothetical protein HHI36_000251, partial [Cryptolaemus montrouzieri]